VRTHDPFPSKLVGARNVHVWLPPSYEGESARRYPVIYANDGQNQFDPKNSFIGVDWALDETMTRLIEEKKIREAIIVAVWNTPKRAQEYVPAKAVRSSIGTWREPAMRKTFKEYELRLEDPTWGLSDEYLKFLVTELKPFLDQQYRTLTNRADTFILGSSAGAMISLSAVCEYPQVFGGAACVSTHWPLGDGVLVEYFRDRLPDPATHLIYFDFGTATLDKNYEPYQLKMDAAMERRGYQAGTNWVTYKFQGSEHSEKDWRKRVHIPLEFLLGKPESKPASE
jgi:predicted alpha/beta superfamily hydrolase